MKNNLKLKKYYLLSLIVSLILSVALVVLISLENKSLTKNYNLAISSIINNVKEKYHIEDNELINILNSNNFNEEFLKKYSIDINEESVILKNNSLKKYYNYLNFAFIFLSLLIIIYLFRLYFRKRNKELNEITNYLKELNNQNYFLKLESMSEDELSKLRDEIYKTTVMLKETAINSKKDKLELKESLENITHQLKTPLTAILITVDNLLDEENLDIKKEEALRSIKREINNMKFLITNLLKLSKLEVNMIEFKNEPNNLITIINKAILNVSSLCDLKDIKIIVKGKNKKPIKCDKDWNVEAITNILKNAIEHSKKKSEVLVNLEENNLYSEIKITNYGEVLSNEDKKHLFERFYHYDSSLKESIGIGLSLAKAIILKSNGTIMVDSKNNETTFIIRYFY